MLTDYDAEGRLVDQRLSYCVPKTDKCPCGTGTEYCANPWDADSYFCMVKAPVNGIAQECPAPCTFEQTQKGMKDCVTKTYSDIRTATSYTCTEEGLCELGEGEKLCEEGDRQWKTLQIFPCTDYYSARGRRLATVMAGNQKQVAVVNFLLKNISNNFLDNMEDVKSTLYGQLQGPDDLAVRFVIDLDDKQGSSGKAYFEITNLGATDVPPQAVAEQLAMWLTAEQPSTLEVLGSVGDYDWRSGAWVTTEDREVRTLREFSQPTPLPTMEPTPVPTFVPTAHPTVYPTLVPTSHPTGAPTAHPTAAPTAAPTAHPTANPTANPTVHPTTARPTPNPTARTTPSPTPNPTQKPTEAAGPTAAPTPTPGWTPCATGDVVEITFDLKGIDYNIFGLIGEKTREVIDAELRDEVQAAAARHTLEMPAGQCAAGKACDVDLSGSDDDSLKTVVKIIVKPACEDIDAWVAALKVDNDVDSEYGIAKAFKQSLEDLMNDPQYADMKDVMPPIDDITIENVDIKKAFIDPSKSTTGGTEILGAITIAKPAGFALAVLVFLQMMK